jgi:hypothetical protein
VAYSMRDLLMLTRTRYARLFAIEARFFAGSPISPFGHDKPIFTPWQLNRIRDGWSVL